jgi:hypothetical protein
MIEDKIKLEVNEKFISEREKQRIKQQAQWDEMYNGTYIYNWNIKNGEKVKIDPLVPLPAVISEISSDLLFGEFPEFKFESDTDTDAVSEWIEDNKEFVTDVLEGATSTSSMGTIFWYLWQMDNQTFNMFIKPSNVLWREDKLGITQALLFKEIERSENNRWAVYKITELDFIWDDNEYKSPYTDPKRQYVTRTYKIKIENPDGTGKDARVIKEVDLEDETVTEWDFMPLIKVNNLKVLGAKSGKSDYQGKEQMFSEIDNRIDQINHVLQENADPWLFVPSGVLDNKNKLNKAQGKMIEKMGGQGDNSVDIVTYDGSLQDAFTQIDKLIELTLFTSRISTPISGFNMNTRQGGQVDSGRALKWKSINTFSMITRKRKYWSEAFQKFFMYMDVMDDDFKLSDDFKMDILWKDGLPLDRQAIVDQVVKEINAGLKSKLQGIKEVNEVDDDMAKKELAQIDVERQAQANIESSKFRVEV